MAEKFKLSADADKIGTLLQSYFQSGNINFLVGSGASMPAIPTAGNIEKEIDDLIKAGRDVDADIKALEFIEALSDKHKTLGTEAIESPVATALSQYTDFLGLIDQILFERKNVLLPRQANLFTSNYDTFVEHAAALIPTLILNDGFRRSGVIDENIYFAPECYFDRTYRSASIYSQSAEIPTINLMKFHGSLSWQRKDGRVAYRRVPPDALPVGDRADAALREAKLAEYFLVFPNVKKYNQALMERTYYDLLRLYANSMERENALLLCFGFSFQDEHILDITKRALRNPTAQVAIIAYNEEAAAQYCVKFEQHRNVIVISPVDGATTDFAAFNGLLKSVLPRMQ